ncbi:MAG: DUF5060 domain-containing protein [Bryobacteraceae bacterium]
MGSGLAVGLFAPALLLAQAGPPSTCAHIPAYSPCELHFELSDSDAAAHPNPYASVDLTIQFRSPHMHTYALPGYWDGGRRMAVRIAPTEAGEWIYRVASNIAGWNGQEGSFTAAPSGAPGFIRPAEVHHWTYTERNLPHLWMGASELGFPSLDDASFRAVADARAAQKFNHLRGRVLEEGAAAYPTADAPNPAYFQRLDERVLYLNRKGVVADLILAARPGVLTRLFPSAPQRRRFVDYLVARYAAMNVTWQGVEEFEADPGSRTLLKEIGAVLKEADPYQHPRTSGARVTSAPLLDDGWMDFAGYGPGADDNVGAIERQLYAVPFVNLEFGREDSGAGKSGPNDLDADSFRHRLWNAAMDGQYVTYANTGAGPRYADSPGAKAMTVWFAFFSATRHWELEPYFDATGGRALALEDAEYIVYLEKPGPVELTVVNRSYEVVWMNPANGETIKEKKQFNGDRFSGEPPDRSHDWVLHLVRPGRLESMARQYRFESRSDEDEDSKALPIALQVVETHPDKMPFVIEQPTGDLSLSIPAPYSVKITRQTPATASMRWLWIGEATGEGQGYRVLATGQSGYLQPPGMAGALPATFLLRLYGMNIYGKVYALTQGCRLIP